MTSATERLRELLDERGVEWEADDTQVDSTGTMYYVTYVKEGYGRTWVYEESPDCDLLVSYNHDLGAEQAVEATLGPGTCEDVGKAAVFKCSECGWYSPVFTFGEEMPRYCPNCGRRVVG